MSIKVISVKCPQCGYREAVKSLDSRDYKQEVQCLRCGFEETRDPVFDATERICGWKTEVTFGAGAVRYGLRPYGGSQIAYCLHEAQEIVEYEAWLRQKVYSGDVVENECYLTRWNDQTKNVESVVGTFFES